MEGISDAINEHAVMFLRSGDDNGAIALLLPALKSIYAQFAQFRGEKPSASDVAMRLRHAGAKERSSSSLIASDLFPIHCRDGEPKMPLYNRAFRLGSDQVSMGCTIATLAFNLAIGHHRKGIHTGDSDELRTALFFYGHAHTLAVTIMPTEFKAITALVSGVYHNMSHIHSQFFQQREARYLSRRLLELYGSASSVYDAHDRCFFQMSLYSFSFDDFCQSPAA